jgi:hypothetical protein
MERSDSDTDDDGRDPDTGLILAYLSNDLSPAEAKVFLERGRGDRAFRQKVAELVLVKGLVMLAMEPDRLRPDPECARVRTMFATYVRGDASPSITAKLSRHLDECIDCDVRFEGYRRHASQRPASETGWRATWRRTTSRIFSWRPWSPRTNS